MQKIKKGDTVVVISGRDKGAKGKVIETYPDEGKLRVEGVFVQKRHVKPGARASMPNGGIVDRPGKINTSKVMFWSEKLGKGVRVGIKTKDDGSKIRVARGRQGKEVELD